MATAHDVCHRLFYMLRISNLNYVITETPYSAQITLRKRFIKDKTGPASPNFLLGHDHEHDHVHTLQQVEHIKEENRVLLEQQKELETSYMKSQEIVDILEEKVSKAESNSLRAFKHNSEQVLVYKNLVKSCDGQMEALKRDLNLNSKSLKEKNKEIYRLDQKSENLSDTLKKLKSELSSLKVENSKLKNQKPVKSKKSCSALTNTSDTKTTCLLKLNCSAFKISLTL